ncbi:MAG: cation:proton antiporter [Actinomycetota bacterium]|nr:cation:proton antiporter [Actinomycetota bacterium]
MAIGALSHEADRAFSASMSYVFLGLAAALVLHLADTAWLDPIHDAIVLERVAEVALIIGVFASGLSLHRALSWRSWGTIVLLIVVVMPLTIALIALFGATVMGLSLGAAVILGAILAPTDPVLAGDVGLGPPGEEGEAAEPRFSLTGEAAINDGLASPAAAS